MFRTCQFITARNSRFVYRQLHKIQRHEDNKTKYVNVQIDYVNEMIERNKIASVDWSEFKKDVLSKPGILNENNINAVLLKTLISSEKIDPAISFATYLKKNMKDLNLGSIIGILRLYFVLGTRNKLTKEDKMFILDTYKFLYDKYKVLESKTCDSLLHALCVIGEWKLAIKVLEDTYHTSTPTHSAFSTLIVTLFRENKKKEALKMVQRSIDNGRPLQDNAYDEWIKYVFRKYKDKKTIAKYLDEIIVHLKDNCITINEEVSKKIEHSYECLEWRAKVTRIGRLHGQCLCCKEKLDSLKLSKEEFNLLQNNVKQKLIVGTDLFLKTSPQELRRFQDFINETAPFDIVLDALNIAYASKTVTANKRIFFLNSVVDYFLEKDKKVLLLGRKHMLKWSKHTMSHLMKKTNCFFTEDISQDDPYLITAAIVSGPDTGFVSKDILRGHKFKLDDVRLRQIFQRWQWEHQWMVFSGRQGGVMVKEPISFTPCAQKKGPNWHIPFEKDEVASKSLNDGIPDLNTWLCIQPPENQNE